MKNIFFTLCSLLILCNIATAQYCGMSGPSVCDDTSTLTAPGFSPISDSLAPFTNGELSSVVIKFENYDTVPSTTFPMISLEIDSITNLPGGLCWAMNDSNNTYGSLQKGCIKISGTVCAPPGQYRVHVWASINNAFLGVDLVGYGLVYFVRVNNAGDTITPVDSVGADFLSYNQTAIGCSAGVNDLEATISSLALYPNPMSSSTQVKFNSIKTCQMTERITNIIGAEVHTATRSVRAGSNSFTIERNNLPAGVYFYSLTEGQTVITKRMIISD